MSSSLTRYTKERGLRLRCLLCVVDLVGNNLEIPGMIQGFAQVNLYIGGHRKPRENK